MLSETDWEVDQFQQLWSSTEELLISYNDKPFVSESTHRARRLGAAPRRWPRSICRRSCPSGSTARQANVRLLSCGCDRSLHIERTRRARLNSPATWRPREDLLMWRVRGGADRRQAVQKARDDAEKHRPGCVAPALDRSADSLAMRETVGLVGDVDDQAWATDQDDHCHSRVGA